MLFRSLLALAFLSLSGSVYAADEVIGGATFVQRDVRGSSPVGMVPVAVQDPVFRNQDVRTGADSAARLTFIDLTNIALDQNSQVRLDEFVFSGQSQRTFELTKGVLRVISGPGVAGHNYQIRTPQVTIGVRGTVFDVAVDGGTTVVSLYDGAVNVCGRGGDCRDMSPGQRITGRMGRIEAIRPIPKPDMVRLLSPSRSRLASLFNGDSRAVAAQRAALAKVTGEEPPAPIPSTDPSRELNGLREAYRKALDDYLAARDGLRLAKAAERAAEEVETPKPREERRGDKAFEGKGGGKGDGSGDGKEGRNGGGKGDGKGDGKDGMTRLEVAHSRAAAFASRIGRDDPMGAGLFARSYVRDGRSGAREALRLAVARDEAMGEAERDGGSKDRSLTELRDTYVAARTRAEAAARAEQAARDLASRAAERLSAVRGTQAAVSAEAREARDTQLTVAAALSDAYVADKAAASVLARARADDAGARSTLAEIKASGTASQPGAASLASAEARSAAAAKALAEATTASRQAHDRYAALKERSAAAWSAYDRNSDKARQAAVAASQAAAAAAAAKAKADAAAQKAAQAKAAVEAAKARLAEKARALAAAETALKKAESRVRGTPTASGGAHGSAPTSVAAVPLQPPAPSVAPVPVRAPVAGSWIAGLGRRR